MSGRGMMKVGTLAKKTGLTVRTLHYYDELGLLKPGERTEHGHRLYGARDVERLQQIVSLRQLGFTLEEIKACLDQPEFSLARILPIQLNRLKEQIERQQAIYRRIEAIAKRIEAAEEISVDEFIQTIEVMTMYEKYYTPEQLKELEERRKTLGEEGMQKAQQEWKELIDEVRAEMEKGTDPASEPVQRLAARWRNLIDAFTGGNPAIEASLNRMYEEKGPEQASRGMVDPELFAYMDKALKAGK